MAQGRPRRMWIDVIKNWTKLDTYEKIKRTAADRLKCRTYTTFHDRRWQLNEWILCYCLLLFIILLSLTIKMATASSASSENNIGINSSLLQKFYKESVRDAREWSWDSVTAAVVMTATSALQATPLLNPLLLADAADDLMSERDSFFGSVPAPSPAAVVAPSPAPVAAPAQAVRLAPHKDMSAVYLYHRG